MSRGSLRPRTGFVPTELVERLEVAEAGNGHLDVLIHAALWPSDPSIGWNEQPPVTTSLDAALALAERVLPGWEVGARVNQDQTATCYVSDGGPIGMSRFQQSEKPTPALALCIAILKATTASSVGTKRSGVNHDLP